MVGREEEDYPDEMEERLVNEEYKIWKKNTPFLYGNALPPLITAASAVFGLTGCSFAYADLVITHALEWPSLTVQWLPVTYYYQDTGLRLLLIVKVLNAYAYLSNTATLITQDKVEVPDSRYSKQKMLLGTHTSEEEQNHLLLAEVHLPTEESELSSAQYDEESSEIGGYGASPGQYSMLLMKCISDKSLTVQEVVGHR